MYALLPPFWRACLKINIALAWFIVAAGGVAAAAIPPNPFVLAWGEGAPVVISAVLVVSCAASIYGVLADRYRFEWVASWFASGALGLYTLTVWWLIVIGVHERLTTAIFTSALLVCVLSRIVACSAHAARLRADYRLIRDRLETMEEIVRKDCDGTP